MINVGVVGMGFMGVTHIKAYRKLPGVNVGAICDAVRLPLDGDLSKVSGNLNDKDPVKLDMTKVKAYKDLKDLLADPDIHLIDLCVPTQVHVPLATMSLRAGKHVVCEKPLARNSTLARQIADEAAKSKGYFMPAMCMRFWPEWAWLRKAVQENRYGKALVARFRRLSEPPAWGRETYFKGEISGGALLDLHIHDTDFVQFCFGRPKSVTSRGFTLYSGAIDYVSTQYEVASGTIVTAEGGWVMTEGFGFHMSYLVNFENATVDFDISRGAEALKVFEKGKAPQVIKCEGVDGYVGELGHMVECIAQGKPPYLVTAQDGLSSVQICEAEEKSIKEGKPISL